MKTIKKYWKQLITISALLIISLGVLGYIVLAPLAGDKVEKIIIDEFNSGTKFSINGYIIPDGFNGYKQGGNYKIVQSKFNILNPVYSLIIERPSQFTNPENGRINEVKSIYLKRDNIFSNLKVDSFKNSEIYESNINKSSDLATQHDLTTDFPGKSSYKITNYPPLTSTEIESNRKLREKDKQGEPLTYYKSQISIAVAFQKAGDKLNYNNKLQEIVDLHKKVLETLNQGKIYTYPDGSILESNDSNKQAVQTIVSEIPVSITK